MGITSAEAAEHNYREFLRSLKIFRQAEADYEAVVDSYEATVRRKLGHGESDTRVRKFAEMAATADNALASPAARCSYFGNRVQTYASAYLVERTRADHQD